MESKTPLDLTSLMGYEIERSTKYVFLQYHTFRDVICNCHIVTVTVINNPCDTMARMLQGNFTESRVVSPDYFRKRLGTQ